MKIGIITLFGNDNYGNKLQNYALQEVLKSLGTIDVETIINEKKSLKKMINNLFDNNKPNDRIQSFIEFNHNIKYSNYTVNMNRPKLNNSYDVLIFGSDQIWNCDFEGKYPLFYGDFKSKAKLISYSASMGKNFIDPKYLNKYIKCLNKFSFISVREISSKLYLESILKKDSIEVHIDPTMLLTSSDWDKISKKPKKLDVCPNKYILNYFLGNQPEEIKSEIRRIARKFDCDIIDLLDKKGKYYNCGPSEFVFLEKNAFLICTDSFHSSVFALIFNKPFIVFERNQKNIESMSSRLDNLIDLFQLKNRKFNGNKITKNNIEHDYSKAYIILEEEQKKALTYLKKAINIKEDDIL